MVLNARDELIHPWESDPLWRESWYFNFSDPKHQIGGWIYFWITPNQELKSGMLVCFYHGLACDKDSTDAAFQSPRHFIRDERGNWVYCYKCDLPDLINGDVDNTEIGGLRMRRVSPLSHYRLEFADGENAEFHLDCNFITDIWDFADNVHPTPKWFAKSRYHRGWRAAGALRIGTDHFRIDTVGDSDHSWGTRDMQRFHEHSMKTYAMQSPNGELSVKAQLFGPPSRELPRGYISINGDMAAVKTITERSRYHPNGLMNNISLRVEDTAGRVIDAQMPELFGAVAGPGPNVGYEGAGEWQVSKWGLCPGIASCWFANGITARELHSGEQGITHPVE